MSEFEYAKRDSSLAAFGGVVLQLFEFIKGLYGNATVLLTSQLFLHFVNDIYLPCCCVVCFVVCQLLRFPECLPLEANKSTENYPTDSIPR